MAMPNLRTINSLILVKCYLHATLTLIVRAGVITGAPWLQYWPQLKSEVPAMGMSLP